MEARQEVCPQLRHGGGVEISRVGPTVRLTWRGPLGPSELAAFRYILSDLTDGQGNLDVEVCLPDVVAVGAPLCDVLDDARARLLSLGGFLSVVTAARVPPVRRVASPAMAVPAGR